MKALTLILSLFAIIWAILMPVFTIWYSVKVCLCKELVLYLLSNTIVFSGIIIYMIIKCIKEIK